VSEKIEKTLKELVRLVGENFDKLLEAVEDAKDIFYNDANDFTIKVEKFGDQIRIRPIIDSEVFLTSVKVPSLDKISEYVEKAKWEWLYDVTIHLQHLLETIHDLIIEIRALMKAEEEKEGK